MKECYKQMFMEQAEAAARASKAVRMKVGCVLVKDGENLSTGLNGMPPKWPTEVCEDRIYSSHRKLKPNQEFPYVDEDGHRHKLVTKPECRHAEIAALEKMWKSHNTTEGSHCFVTLSPCLNCSIKLHTAGVTEVYYRNVYRSLEGIAYLIKNGIKVEQLSPE